MSTRNGIKKKKKFAHPDLKGVDLEQGVLIIAGLVERVGNRINELEKRVNELEELRTKNGLEIMNLQAELRKHQPYG